MEAAVRRPAEWEEPLARAGLVAKGVSYGLVGVLAIGVAVGVGGAATSRQGALHRLAGNGFGKVVLVLLCIGFAAYALWRVVQALQDARWTKRIAYVGRAVVYAGLTYSAAEIVVGSGGGQSQSQKTQRATAVVLDWPAGRELVIAASAALVGVGAWNLYRGISRSFADKWRGHSTWGCRAGVAGHVARFVVFALIGIFAFRAAVDYDPRDAVGLDGALQRLAHATYGPYLLGLTAAGLVAYALYCFVDARYRDVTR